MTFSLLIDDYYILGDSLSDVNNFLSFTSSPSPLPTTPLYFPGQFTNGLVDENGQPIPNADGLKEGVWVEYFAQELNLEFSSFYSDAGNVDTTKDGINFAIGGATSGDANLGGLPAAALTRQVNDLTTTVDSLEDDLAFVWIGSNDYFAAISTFPEPDVEAIVTQVVETNISVTLTTLLNQGLDVVVVPNLPDLKETPLGDGNPILTQLTDTHNKLLANALEKLGEDYPNAKIISVDIHAKFAEIFDTFSNTDQAVTATDIYNDVLDTDLLVSGIPGYKKASDSANNAFWWDSAHPTTAVHYEIADYIMETIESELVISGTNGKDELIGGNGKEYIVGLNGKDTIKGGTGDDLIDGGKGKDQLFGQEGDDIFIGSKGKDLINGGSGSDTVIYDGFKDNFSFQGTVDKFKVKAPGIGKDTLIDIEFLQFQDGVFATEDLLYG